MLQGQLRFFFSFLVPKLRLGTLFRETPFRVPDPARHSACETEFRGRRSQTEFGNETGKILRLFVLERSVHSRKSSFVWYFYGTMDKELEAGLNRISAMSQLAFATCCLERFASNVSPLWGTRERLLLRQVVNAGWDYLAGNTLQPEKLHDIHSVLDTLADQLRGAPMGEEAAPESWPLYDCCCAATLLLWMLRKGESVAKHTLTIAWEYKGSLDELHEEFPQVFDDRFVATETAWLKSVLTWVMSTDVSTAGDHSRE
jgi:hypothetical protein